MIVPKFDTTHAFTGIVWGVKNVTEKSADSWCGPFNVSKSKRLWVSEHACMVYYAGVHASTRVHAGRCVQNLRLHANLTKWGAASCTITREQVLCVRARAHIH